MVGRLVVHRFLAAAKQAQQAHQKRQSKAEQEKQAREEEGLDDAEVGGDGSCEPKFIKVDWKK